MLLTIEIPDSQYKAMSDHLKQQKRQVMRDGAPVIVEMTPEIWAQEVFLQNIKGIIQANPPDEVKEAMAILDAAAASARAAQEDLDNLLRPKVRVA